MTKSGAIFSSTAMEDRVMNKINKLQALLKKIRIKQPIVLVSLVVFALGLVVSISLIILERGEEKDEEGFASVLKIGFTTDWEYGSRTELKHKRPIQALTELEKVVTFYNDVFKPDIVIGGGDYIESSSTRPEKTKNQLREIYTLFQKVSAPKLYALGNHDMRSLSKTDVMSILGIAESHSLQDIGDWRLVVIDTNFNKEDESDRNAKNYVDGYVSQAELLWLDARLATERPTLVFSHHSPLRTLDDGNHPTRNIINDEALRALLEKHANVVAVISGHTPKAQHAEVNGIHYFVADTLVNVEGLGAFATVVATFNKRTGKAETFFEHYGLNRQTFQGNKNIYACSLPENAQKERCQESFFQKIFSKLSS